MAFPTTSDPFRHMITDALENDVAYDLTQAGAGTIQGALFNDSVTGTKDDTAAEGAYNGTNWGTGNEISDTTGWAAGGRVLDNCAISNPSSGVVRFDCDDEVGGSCTTGLTAFFGWLVYDGNLASDPGLCFNYFGGTNSVSAGATLTVAINANGLFEITI